MKAGEAVTAEMVIQEEMAHLTIMLCRANDVIIEVLDEETLRGVSSKPLDYSNLMVFCCIIYYLVSECKLEPQGPRPNKGVL